MTKMLDRTPWECSFRSEWEPFCSVDEYMEIPKSVCGLFTRFDAPLIEEDDYLSIGETPCTIYIKKGNSGIWEQWVNSKYFVNSNLHLFVLSLELFASSYPYYSDESSVESIYGKRKEIHSALLNIDPAAFSSVDNFWPTFLDTFTGYGEFSVEFLKDEYGVTEP